MMTTAPRTLARAALAATCVVAATRPSDDGTIRSRAMPAVDSIASPAGPGAAEPNLVVGDDGLVYMSWLEPVDSGYAFRFATLRGTRWSAARTIRQGKDFFVNWADFPSMAVLDGGRLAAHWLQRTATGTYAYGVRLAQSRDGGVTWSAPVTPHRDSTNTEHGFVALWREREGLGAVWLDGRKFRKDGHDASNEMMLVSTVMKADGRLDAESRLDERTCDCCQNSAAMTSSGPLIAYRNRSADEIRDVYITRRVGGRWTTGVPVHADNWKINACPVNGPAIDASGTRAVIAWFTAANDSARVLLAFSKDAGATFDQPIRVDGGKPAGRVDVAMLADGGALVTWIERTGGDTAAVRLRRIARSGRASGETTIASSSAARASGFPRMAVTGSHVVFAWTLPGKPSSIRVARTTLDALR